MFTDESEWMSLEEAPHFALIEIKIPDEDQPHLARKAASYRWQGDDPTYLITLGDDRWLMQEDAIAAGWEFRFPQDSIQWSLIRQARLEGRAIS